MFTVCLSFSGTGILKNRMGCPPALQGLSSVGRVPSELSWYRTSTLGHRGMPAASYGRMCSGSLSQPASRYSSREHLDSLARRQRSRDNLDLLPRRRELGGSRERLGPTHSAHTSREDLAGPVLEAGLGGSRSQLTRRQLSREHLGGAIMSSRSREQLETAGAGGFGGLGGPNGAGPCREWLRTLPPRQPSHPEQPPPSSPPPPISEEPPELLPTRRGRLDSAPPCRYPPPLNAGPLGAGAAARDPSSEHLDILSSILASFSSSVLAPPATNPQATGPSPSPPHSATSHSISEVSPDAE